MDVGQHHTFCEGHIFCPKCDRDSCARPVVVRPDGTADTVICLGCYGRFGVTDGAPPADAGPGAELPPCPEVAS